MFRGIRGSHPDSSSYERITYPRTEPEASPTPILYNSGKLCKPFRYLERKRNKWNYEDGGGGGRFQRGKVSITYLDEERGGRRYRGVELMTSLPVFRKGKELGKGWPSS